MLNKFLIPATLLATVVIAGIFAFMPVEKASTVHSTLATTSSINTLSDTVNANNRAITFYFNMTHGTRTGSCSTSCGNNMTIILSEPGKTITGYATLTLKALTAVAKTTVTRQPVQSSQPAQQPSQQTSQPASQSQQKPITGQAITGAENKGVNFAAFFIPRKII